MNILHINATDFNIGAGGVVKALMDGGDKAGHKNSLFVFKKLTTDSRVFTIPSLTAGWGDQLAAVQKMKNVSQLLSGSLLSIFKDPHFEAADLIHLHATGDEISFLLLPFLAAKPLVWSLYEPHAFTAGCQHTAHCNRWKEENCSECPVDKSQKKVLDRPFMQKLKSDMYKLSRFTVVCPREWLKGQAEQSILREQDICLIRPGVDTDIFHNADRLEVRKSLGLPLDKKIILFSYPGGFNNYLSGGTVLLQALQSLAKDNPQMYLINIGTRDQSPLAGLSIPRRDLPGVSDQQTLAKYYQAADVFAFPTGTDIAGFPIMEAAACGTPTVAFGVGAAPELIVQEKSGILVRFPDASGFANGLNYLLSQSTKAEFHSDIAKRAQIAFPVKNTVKEYLQLYDELAATAKSGATIMGIDLSGQFSQNGEMPKIETSGETYESLLEKLHIPEVVKTARKKGWDRVWREYKRLQQMYPKERERERGVFTDTFYLYCLKTIDPKVDASLMWQIICDWFGHRKIPARCGHFLPTEQTINLAFINELRNKMEEYFAYAPIAEFGRLTGVQQTQLINLWRMVFFNDFSTVNLMIDQDNEQKHQDFERKYFDGDWYPTLLTLTMYQPHASDNIQIDIEKLLTSSVPVAVKVILIFWLINTPYYNADENNLKITLKHSEAFCLAGIKHPDAISKGFFFGSVEHLTPNFWRASYIGGNNVQALSTYGDFISDNMRRLYPEFSNQARKLRKKRPGERIRIGYISSNFCQQAVAFYMINRFLHRDKSRFEVATFLLEKRWDHMTDQIKECSDEFIVFKDFNDIETIAKQIIDKELDILIYTDIGMEQVTYKLGAMQLAPIQCALVGHGVTTGLPTIQYYISGDFEPQNADNHYREKLIRLPNLGAAQYPPELPDTPLNRKNFNLPDDAVIFISCANGIKHGPERDKVLIEILRKADNACIALKPFMTPHLTDKQFIDRLQSAAERAGVRDRLIILPPLEKSTDLMSLLLQSDVQLDTYPYGGWTTNMEALYAGLPIITQEGDMARNRWGAALLKTLGVTEGIAGNESEYIDWAVRFAHNPELRYQIRDQIKSKVKSVLFNGISAQKDYEEILIELYNNHLGKQRQTSKEK